MALIYWIPSFNTNIDIIDQQHRMLVDLVNQLNEAHQTGKDRQILLKLIEKLGVYAATHFAREEDLFEAHGYPNADEHLQEHDYFEDMLFQFEDEFKAGKQDLTFNVLMFLSDWLVNHINGSDKDYIPFLTTNKKISKLQDLEKRYRGNSSIVDDRDSSQNKVLKEDKKLYRGQSEADTNETTGNSSKKKSKMVYRGQS